MLIPLADKLGLVAKRSSSIGTSEIFFRRCNFQRQFVLLLYNFNVRSGFIQEIIVIIDRC